MAPQLVVRRLFDTPDGYEELRQSFGALWRAGAAAWTPDARRVFTELGLASVLPGGHGRRRQLLESETFRALLAREGQVAFPEAA